MAEKLRRAIEWWAAGCHCNAADELHRLPEEECSVYLCVAYSLLQMENPRSVMHQFLPEKFCPRMESAYKIYERYGNSLIEGVKPENNSAARKLLESITDVKQGYYAKMLLAVCDAIEPSRVKYVFKLTLMEFISRYDALIPKLEMLSIPSAKYIIGCHSLFWGYGTDELMWAARKGHAMAAYSLLSGLGLRFAIENLPKSVQESTLAELRRTIKVGGTPEGVFIEAEEQWEAGKYELAFRTYKLSAALGYTYAYFELYNILSRGKGTITQDVRQAGEWMAEGYNLHGRPGDSGFKTM